MLVSVLVSALLAKIAEVEKLANDCIAYIGSNRVGDEYADGSGIADQDDFPSYPWGSGDLELAFMAGPGHPDDVLRLCRAHRDIIETYEMAKAEYAKAAGQVVAEGPDSPASERLARWAHEANALTGAVAALARGLGVEETEDR